MKKLLLLFLILAGGSGAWGKEVHITILHTTDLHANVLPTTDYNGNMNVGGAARCATMIRKIRSAAPHVLVVDAGDLYQGTALGWLTKGSAMTRYINELQYDSWTPGNHEFDWGIDKVAARFTEAKVPILAANLHHQPLPDTPPGITSAFQKIQSYLIKDFEGVKVGMVGLDTPGIPDWSRPRLIPGITLEDSVSALKRVIPRMKAEGAQILILVTHQGIREEGDDHANQLNGVIQSFPELDVIIGGHTHKLFKEQMIRGILYTQANYWGTYLGRVDLDFDTEKNRLVRKSADALPMDSAVPGDSRILEILKPDLERTQAYLEQKIGENSAQIDTWGGPKKETTCFDLLGAAIAEAIESRGGRVDAVVHGLLNERVFIDRGPVYMRDVFQVVPYENTIGVATITGEQLLAVLEENATALPGGRFRGLWGMTMKLNPSAPPWRRVLFLGDREGRSLNLREKYRVAFNSYELAGGGKRWMTVRKLADDPACELKEYDFQTRDAVAEYIRKHSPLNIEKQGWWEVEKGRRQKAEERKSW